MKQAVLIAVASAFSVYDTVAFTVISKSTSSLQRTTSTRNYHHVLRSSKDDLDELRMRREKEILDAGGDPSFLSDEDLIEDVVEEEEDVDMPSMSLLNTAGISEEVANVIGGGESEEEAVAVEAEVVPPFLWDGEYDERAYFDD